jgi:Domain of unknown function (DUF4124)
MAAWALTPRSTGPATAAGVRPVLGAFGPLSPPGRLAPTLGIAMCPLHTRTAFLMLFLLTSGVASAATVYRWVDDQGKVNYSETVPEQFRSRAKAIDASANQPSAAQQQESLERAQKDKERAAASSPDSTRQPVKSARAASAPRAFTKIPSQIPNEQTDCETWQRLYLESSDCFGPYRTVRGATKPEAFEYCNVVPEPPPRCRPRIP